MAVAPAAHGVVPFHLLFQRLLAGGVERQGREQKAATMTATPMRYAPAGFFSLVVNCSPSGFIVRREFRLHGFSCMVSRVGVDGVRASLSGVRHWKCQELLGLLWRSVMYSELPMPMGSWHLKHFQLLLTGVKSPSDC